MVFKALQDDSKTQELVNIARDGGSFDGFRLRAATLLSTQAESSAPGQGYSEGPEPADPRHGEVMAIKHLMDHRAGISAEHQDTSCLVFPGMTD